MLGARLACERLWKRYLEIQGSVVICGHSTDISLDGLRGRIRAGFLLALSLLQMRSSAFKSI